MKYKIGDKLFYVWVNGLVEIIITSVTKNGYKFIFIENEKRDKHSEGWYIQDNEVFLTKQEYYEEMIRRCNEKIHFYEHDKSNYVYLLQKEIFLKEKAK